MAWQLGSAREHAREGSAAPRPLWCDARIGDRGNVVAEALVVSTV
jgi:hypothetical protein